jgi:septal ring factor EnvC (AmiA/AmiB activator)
MFQGYALGAIDYLLKPVRPAVLRSKVLVFMDLYRKTGEVNELKDELGRLRKEHEALKATLKKENETRKRIEAQLRQSEDSLKKLDADLGARTVEGTPAVG